MDPYGRQPWLTVKDMKVQVTWTLTNVDGDAHNAELVIDPWNEFRSLLARHAGPRTPRIRSSNRTLSGIDTLYSLEGSGAGRRLAPAAARSTFADMEEMAIDFSTTLDLIAFPAAPRRWTRSPPRATAT